MNSGLWYYYLDEAEETGTNLVTWKDSVLDESVPVAKLTSNLFVTTDRAALTNQSRWKIILSGIDRAVCYSC